VEMIAMPQILPLAVKYATKCGRMHLSSKISELMPVFKEKVSEKIHFSHSFYVKYFQLTLYSGFQP
jgi:hypothetical protein